MYEVLPTEPLHDMKEHISNVVTEIVAHLTDDEKKNARGLLNWCQDQRNNYVVQTTERWP